MKIKIKIEKKHAFVLLLLGVLLLGLIIVNALVYNLVPIQGHGGDRITIMDTSDREKTLQDAITNGDLSPRPTNLVISHSADYSYSGSARQEYSLGSYDICFLERVSGTTNIGCNVYSSSGTFYLEFPAMVRQGTSSCRAQCWRFEPVA